MKIVKKQKTHFKECENTTTPKILLNICDYVKYGLTDTNEFYRNWYVNPERDYNKLQENSKIKLGDCFFSTPLSYHTIANLVCVKLPKTSYNIIPFKYESFKTSLLIVKEYIDRKEIKEIHTPIFGTKIIEGSWLKIMNIIKYTFDTFDDLIFNVYE